MNEPNTQSRLEEASETIRIVADLKKQVDEQMLLVKACEHIAEGDDGWERLRNICPSTAAVAKLRDDFTESVMRLSTELEDGKAENARLRMLLSRLKAAWDMPMDEVSATLFAKIFAEVLALDIQPQPDPMPDIASAFPVQYQGAEYAVDDVRVGTDSIAVLYKKVP